MQHFNGNQTAGPRDRKNGKRILAIDDDPDVLQLMRKILVREGYEVASAQSGEEAMALLDGQKFDLFLLDIMMPGMDGFEVSRKLRSKGIGKSVPVVFITAKNDADSMREGFRSGGTVFLSKPFTAVQLVRLVRAMLP